MALLVNVASVSDELYILAGLSFFGWVNFAFWLILVAVGPMEGFPLEESIGWLMAGLPSCVLLSPAICLVSEILSVLCHLLFMLALDAFLWYNLAIYTCYLAAATPRYAYFRANYLNMFY
jgi:hypothetical protein